MNAGQWTPASKDPPPVGIAKLIALAREHYGWEITGAGNQFRLTRPGAFVGPLPAHHVVGRLQELYANDARTRPSRAAEVRRSREDLARLIQRAHDEYGWDIVPGPVIDIGLGPPTQLWGLSRGQDEYIGPMSANHIPEEIANAVARDESARASRRAAGQRGRTGGTDGDRRTQAPGGTQRDTRATERAWPGLDKMLGAAGAVLANPDRSGGRDGFEAG